VHSKESAKERTRFTRNANNLVCCLPIEFEIELDLRPAVVPDFEGFQFAASEAPFRLRSASDGNTDAWRLPGDATLLWDCLGGSDDAA
jgi:hypothetical protein